MDVERSDTLILDVYCSSSETRMTIFSAKSNQAHPLFFKFKISVNFILILNIR